MSALETAKQKVRSAMTELYLADMNPENVRAACDEILPLAIEDGVTQMNGLLRQTFESARKEQVAAKAAYGELVAALVRMIDSGAEPAEIKQSIIANMKMYPKIIQSTITNAFVTEALGKAAGMKSDGRQVLLEMRENLQELIGEE